MEGHYGELQQTHFLNDAALNFHVSVVLTINLVLCLSSKDALNYLEVTQCYLINYS